MTNIIYSIIIPTYNEEIMLPRCLDSINSLSYPKDNVEVIVVDNGSKDNTREIAKLYGAKVLRDDDKNVSGLRNLGVRESKGAILVFLDADCIVEKEWLRNAEKYINEVNIVGWGSPPTLPDSPTWVQKTWYIIRKKQNLIEKVDWLESMNLFVRRKYFTEIGGFNESLVTCEDVDFSYRLRKYGDIMSDQSIAAIHLGEAQTVRQFFKKEVWRGKSNLHGLISHGLTLKEIPSLSIPIYFGILLPLLLIIYFITQKILWLICILVVFILPTVVLLSSLIKKKIGLKNIFKLIYLIQVYFFARTIAVLKNDRR